MNRVRFAPSPTGHLHIGGARTALFNYLFAKKYGGTFILRIEDTDELRSTGESVKSIFESMKWLGLNWDEGAMPDGSEKGPFGPYVQSAREAAGVYKKYSEELLKSGKAYECYCTPAELDEMRKKAQLEKRPPKYEGLCRNLTAARKKEFEAQGRKPVIRFRMPDDGVTAWNDLIHKDVKFENKLLYDFIMIKASGYPTYNFACVIDDHLMEITHVIRGDDHISNTPLQINLYTALGWKIPELAHLSMILGPDGTRLSKRHGATSVGEYRNQGYLPQTMRNYLALLGWSTVDSQQIFKEGELEEKFDLKGCQKSPAIFDPVKLNWMNGEYIRGYSKEALLELALPYIKEAGLPVEKGRAPLADIVALEQEKYKLLSEIPGLIKFFFTEVEYDPKAVEKTLKTPDAGKILEGVKGAYASLNVFKEAEIEAATRAFAKAGGFKAGAVFHPVRVAVSGRTEGPTLFRMIEYLGREESLKRLAHAATLI
ncbi:MAG: glutamate--tRNA ligase [Elusimicrobia bacterium GWA2_56_46]|nr:MAG: glutamate--tRNA ligase [Elusimicrobia bacterium GWA2_56_46]OGR55173.1 MAG: glutamate--tRNA ligase [Elusimicrobia bacterium GWC2_56_31]HBB67855.1 glutamate--tRNA ligase [Elusimicrobiota bacterium]HBW23754.1 glutamate--tRNA ligase [Elusimicrobiota bacterium]